MRHWPKEPLLHFLVAGGLLFLEALATSSAAELGDRSLLERDCAHADEQTV